MLVIFELELNLNVLSRETLPSPFYHTYLPLPSNSCHAVTQVVKLWPGGQILLLPICVNKVLVEHRHMFVGVVSAAAFMVQWQS